MSGVAEVSTPSRRHAGFAQPLVGVAVGVLAFYTAALASSRWFEIRGPVVTLVMMFLAGASVFLGWRWPRTGLAAGLVTLVLVASAWIASYANPWAQPSSWMDWPMVWAHGGGTTFVPVVGTVLVCASIAGRLPTPRP